jgi:hypothetical protein
MSAYYDVLFYYTGGTERGEWRECLATPAEFPRIEEELRRAGYVSRRGRRSIGAPEGPPAELLAGGWAEWRRA